MARSCFRTSYAARSGTSGTRKVYSVSKSVRCAAGVTWWNRGHRSRCSILNRTTFSIDRTLGTVANSSKTHPHSSNSLGWERWLRKEVPT